MSDKELLKTILTTIESMNNKFDGIEKGFESMDKKFGSIDKKFDSIDKKFDSINKKFDTMDKRFDIMDKRFDTMDKRFDTMDKRFDTMEFKLNTVITQQQEDHLILKALEHKAEVNKAEHDKMFMDIADIKGQLKNVNENIDGMKEIIGRHEVDITVLKRRPV